MSADHIPATVKMVPGPDLDRLMVEKVMKWTGAKHHGETLTAYDNGRCVSAGPVTAGGDRIDFAPSRNISRAWELAGHVSYLTGGFSVAHDDDVWCAAFGESDPCGCQKFSATGETAPHAICIAALRAVGAV